MENENENLEIKLKNKCTAIIIGSVLSILLLVFTIVIALNLYFFQSTNNALIEINPVNIQSKISGRISELNFDNDSEVKKGEILLQIDSLEYQNALDEAVNKLEKVKKDYNSFSSDIEKIITQTKASQENIKKAKLKMENANSDYVRYKNAFKDGSVTKQDLDNAVKNLYVAKLEYDEAQNSLKLSDKVLKSALNEKNIKTDEIDKLMNDVEQAKLNLSNTTIYAPADGKIINKNVQISEEIQPEKLLLTIIPKECFVIANFNKTDISSVKIGQKAVIKAKNKKIKGITEEITENTVKIRILDDISNYNFAPDQKASVKIRIK